MTVTEHHRPVGVAEHRLNFRFSGTARRAACLVADGQGRLRVETWTFGPGTAVATPAATAGETVRTQLTPAEDGRVLLVRNGPGRHEVALAGDHGAGAVERPVATMHCAALRALPARDVATLGWLLAVHAAGHTVVYRVDAGAPRPEPVLELPGHLTGAAWLDEAGTLLVANQVTPGARRTVAVDLWSGRVRALDGPGAAILLTSPRRGRILVATATATATATGTGTGTGRRSWLGWRAVGPEVDHPAALNSLTGAVLPLAVDPTGRYLAIRVTAGVRSRLFRHDADTDTLTELPVAPGVIRSAGWNDGGLRLLHTGPTRPTTVLTLPDAAAAGAAPVSPGAAAPTRRDDGWHDARVERFPGPVGAVEAVVYGDRWRSRHLVVALHGGPEAAWDLGFDPLWQDLAAAGACVVAPNQRGSTGYGGAHRDAIVGAWGGPDLADVRHLLGVLVRDRPAAAPAPALFGVSYGAYLALLAAAADPYGWARCVAVAPFLSGPSLYRDAAPAVRALLDRLGGRTELADELGPRDLLRLAPRIRARLLVVHGRHDDVIPVGQSRALAHRLGGLGRREPDQFHYREIPDGGHNPFDGPGGRDLRAEVVDFLVATGTR